MTPQPHGIQGWGLPSRARWEQRVPHRDQGDVEVLRPMAGARALVGQARCLQHKITGVPRALASPKKGYFVTLYTWLPCFPHLPLALLAPRSPPSNLSLPCGRPPMPPSRWCLADSPIRGQGFRTCAGKPFLVNFSQGARKLVITLCRAEMKQADRLHLITM